MCSARRKLGPPPNQTARVVEIADHGLKAMGETPAADRKILGRIEKCLQRANHPNTPELEAKAAWRMASRLMAHYNVTQADVLEEASNKDDYASLGGQSVVSIKSTKAEFGRAIHQAWVHDVAEAMEIYFDCSSYSTSRATSVDWNFYGIAANTVPAAIAFEGAHNLLLEWARSKKRFKPSYCLGVAEGLVAMAEKDKEEERKQAQGSARQQQQQQRDSLLQDDHGHKGEADRNGGKEERSKSSIACHSQVHEGDDQIHLVQLKDANEDDSKPSLKQEDRKNGEYQPTTTVMSNEDHEKKPVINLENSSDAGVEKTSANKREDDDSIELRVYSDRRYVSDDLIEDNENTGDEDDTVEVEATFKEEDEKPIDLHADFESQLQDMLPFPVHPTAGLHHGRSTSCTPEQERNYPFPSPSPDIASYGLTLAVDSSPREIPPVRREGRRGGSQEAENQAA